MDTQTTTLEKQPLTLDEILQAFRELNKWSAQHAREFERRSREFEQLSRETDRRFKDLERHLRETDRMIEKMAARADRQREWLDKKMGRFTDIIGHFAESMVEPALVRLFRQRGILINHTARDLVCREPGLEMEVDLVGVDEEYTVVVEVKNTLRVQDVDRHLERLARFKQAFPMYRDKKIIGAVAGMRVPSNVARYAYKKGLYVLAQSGETMQVLNDENFHPRLW